MGLKRLADKRPKRTKTWASVCASLFGNPEEVTEEHTGENSEKAT